MDWSLSPLSPGYPHRCVRACTCVCVRGAEVDLCIKEDYPVFRLATSQINKFDVFMYMLKMFGHL